MEIRDTNKLERLPLSFSQQRLWFLYQLEVEDRYSYNIPLQLDFEANLNLPVFNYALNSLAQMQTSFRTIFLKDTNGEPYQQILSMTECYIHVLPRLCHPRDVDMLLNATRMQEFNVEQPSTRLLLLHNNKTLSLSFVQHHLITDGWSMGVMARELAAVYSNAVKSSSLNRAGSVVCV